MKQYPEIPKQIRDSIHIYAFDKLDGNNIRAEWSFKRGFYKFGSRNALIDENTKPLGQAVNLIKQKYEEDMAMVFKEHRWREVICFFELHGPGSFAGQHPENETQTVTLFDVNPYKEGILGPLEFIRYFSHLDIPKVLYEGRADATFVEKVRQSTLKGMTFEGVVCKGANDKKTKIPVMFKIKSRAWLDKLKTYCSGDDSLFNKLA
jgi:hypothetical protein